jgi:hypothetical protein
MISGNREPVVGRLSVLAGHRERSPTWNLSCPRVTRPWRRPLHRLYRQFFDRAERKRCWLLANGRQREAETSR